ncbi:MAG: hypothetical protein U0744_20685 [Gemmataceae bacterium]
MALLHRVGGFDTMLLGMTVLLASFAAWLVYRHFGSGMHPLFATLLVGFGFFAASYHFYARPHLATIVLTGVTVAYLSTPSEAKVAAIARLAGAALRVVDQLPRGCPRRHHLGRGRVRLVELIVSRRLRFADPHMQRRGLLGFIFAGCCLATLINPFGLDLHRTWFSIVGTKTVQLISEHKPLNPNQIPGRVTLIYGAFVLFVLIGTLPRWPRGTRLLPAVWLLASLTSIRHGPLLCRIPGSGR